jgi:hypothetical protein
VSLIRMFKLITCLSDPKSWLEFKIKFQFRSFQVLGSVDRLAQLAIFDILLEPN